MHYPLYIIINVWNNKNEYPRHDFESHEEAWEFLCEMYDNDHDFINENFVLREI